MSNTSNLIQNSECLQQKDKNIQTFRITKQQFEENKFLNDTIKNPRYAIAFLYLITHKETGYIYSGSKLAYSLKEANTYCGSSEGNTISDICTKDKILQNGVDQYEFKLIMFCKSTEQLGELELDLNHFNIYFNKMKCVNGTGRNAKLRSTAGISPMLKTKQKISNTLNNRTPEEREEYRQKRRKTWDNKPEEEKEEIQQKKREKMLGENNPMFGKNAYVNKTEDEMNVIKAKLSVSSSKPKVKYICPHDGEIRNATGFGNMMWYIEKNYPDKKQWNQYTKKEKEKFKVI